MRIVGVLLAAGRGTRFGADKLLAPLPQRSSDASPPACVGVAAARHLASAIPDSLAVVRDDADGLARQLGNAGLRVVRCERADEGMGASLACGVAAAPDADGWIIALGDMPWIAPSTIGAIAAALADGADLVAPAYRSERGHPVGFARRHYAALAALRGDAGARAVVERERKCLTLIDVADAGVVRDVDLPGDLTA